MKKPIASVVVMLAGVAVAVTPEIRNVMAKQRWPWNGKVDITYEVVGDVMAGVPSDCVPAVRLSATDGMTGSNYVAKTSTLSGDMEFEEGTHKLVWDMTEEGLSFESSNVVFNVSCETAPAPYCVVDLSAGADATNYPVIYMAEPPSGGFNTNEYKTTKLVLRLIEPGSFMMSGHEVTLTKPFYCGIFEVTQKQCELFAGYNYAYLKGDMRPVDDMTWWTLRGSESNWPSSTNVAPNSRIGLLRTRTGLNFDLPTEAQWEYACRAGTTSRYNNGGDTEDDLKLLGRYKDNQSDGKGGYSDGPTTVGSYLPNAWGLYDMHGNIEEWCLDWQGDFTGNVIDPVGPSSGSKRVKCGGRGEWFAEACTSSSRSYQNPGYMGGFRLVITLSDSAGTQGAGTDAVTGTTQAGMLCVGASPPVTVDLRIGTEPVVDSIILPWNAEWIGGDTNATVVITDNGAEVKCVTGTGEFALSDIGRHELTYTTYIDGVALDEVYAATVFAKWKYEVEDDGAVVVETTQTAGTVAIPSEIDGYPVTALGAGVFENCTNLTAVTIPSSVTNIGSEAFGNCGGLTNIVFEGNAPSVGVSALSGVNSDCIGFIPRSSSGWSVPIPGEWNGLLITYPWYVVDFNANGGTCVEANRNVAYGSAIGVLPNATRDDYDLVGWFTAAEGGEPFNGEGTVATADFTLYAHWTPKPFLYTVRDGKVVIRKCSSPEGDIVIPSVVDGYPVTGIADNAFGRCSRLTSVVIPESVTEIGSYAFYGCSGLTNVVIQEGVGYIGYSTFSGCRNLSNVMLPSSVENIGYDAFSWCSGLMSIEVSGDNEVYSSTNGLLLSKDGTTLVQGVNGVVTIPDDVTDIEDRAFFGCSGLTVVTVADSVEYICDSAFDGCSGLATVYLSRSYDGPESVFPSGAEIIRYKAIQTVVFDANGGDVSPTNTTVAYGATYGSLPEPVREGYSFGGWTLDGEPVTSDTAVLTLDDHTLLAQWTVNSYAVTFDANGGIGGTNTMQNYGAAIVAPTVSRMGYTFKGWVPGVAETVPANNVTYTAQWEINHYTVTFNVNGGECGTGSVVVDHGAAVGDLPVPTREDAVFLGWFTEAEGGVEVDASRTVTEEMTFYAHWLTEVALPTVTTDGTSTVFRTESCEVTITCATAGATIYYTDDGTTPRKNDDYRYVGPFTITETTTIKAVAVIEGIQSDYVTVTITKQLLTLEEALDVGGSVTVATGATTPWVSAFDANAKVGDATVRSGAIGNRTNTWLSATVSGMGTMTFWCKTSCEHDEDGTFTWDRLMVYTNDVEIGVWRMDGETDWTQRELTFEGGENTVKWVYHKDKNGAEGEDCAWVDGITWTPSGASGLAAWLAERNLTAESRAANGRTAAECYALGLDPALATNDFRIVSIEMVDGKPKVEWEPKTNRWTGVEIQAVLKGAAALEGPWADVPAGGNPAYRFFKVVVEVP